MLRILVTDRFAINAQARLKTEKDLSVETLNQHEEINKKDLSQYEVMIIRSRTIVDQSFLERAKNLKMIVTTTSGYDHIDLKATSQKNIKTFYTPEANTQSAAELTWALIMACSRRLNQAEAQVRKGNWQRETIMGFELHKKTLGIIGLGRVGSRVAKIAHSFDMNLIGFDPFVDPEVFTSLKCRCAGWDEVLRECDILTLHVPLTEKTKHFINQATLESINRGIVIINTSRGRVLNEQDVLKALRQKKISYLGLDVFEKEPLPKGSALLEEPNVIFTPHVGANTTEAFERGSQAAVDAVVAFRDGGSIRHELTERDICQQ